MAEYNVDGRKLGALIFEHEDRRRRRVTAAVAVAAHLGAQIVKENAPKATMRLSDSVGVEEHSNGNAEVVVRAPHAQAVEIGSRPHMPPVPPLIEWAEAIGAADPRDTAWAVANKIKYEGTKPRWFVRRSLPEIMKATGMRIRYVLTK